MLGKLFGKKSGYFLELSEEEQESDVPVEATPKSEKTAPEKTEAAVAKTAPAAEQKTVEKQPAAEAEQTAAKAPSTAAYSDPVELIRTALAASATTADEESSEPEGNFATDYLVTQTLPRRRRPGPSLSPFKSMAKDVRKRRTGGL